MNLTFKDYSSPKPDGFDPATHRVIVLPVALAEALKKALADALESPRTIEARPSQARPSATE